MLLACQVVGKKSLQTVCHFIFNIHYEKSFGISNILKYFRCGTMFMVSVNLEQSWSGVIIECSEHGGEIVDAPLRSHTLPDNSTQMWLFVNDCPPTGLSTE